MVANQNLHRSIKCLASDDDNIPKKLAKKLKPKRAFFDFGTKNHILLSRQENKEAGFTGLLPLSWNIATPSRITSKESKPFCSHLYLDKIKSVKLKLASFISPHRRQKAALSNQKPPINKT